MNLAIQPMTKDEAVACVAEIRTGIENVGRRLFELHEGKGWLSLGYPAWQDCVDAEFQFSRQRAHQLLTAESVNRTVSTMVDAPLSERVTREVAKAGTPEQQREVIAEAVATAPKGKDGKPKLTAKHVQQVVARRVEPAPSPPAELPPMTVEDLEPEKEPEPKPAALPWDAYNAKLAEFAGRFDQLRDDILAFANTTGVDAAFVNWLDASGYRKAFTDYATTFKSHAVTGWATEREAALLPGQRNFFYALDGKKRRVSA